MCKVRRKPLYIALKSERRSTLLCETSSKHPSNDFDVCSCKLKACYPFPDEFGPNYPKVLAICRFFIYYVIPLSIIAVFYMLMARHLMRSTRNIIGEMQGQVKFDCARLIIMWEESRCFVQIQFSILFFSLAFSKFSLIICRQF